LALDNKSLFEQSILRVVSEEELLISHQNLVSEYFKYVDEKKPQILKDALRQQIEKIESQLIKIEEI
jgi:hypothetical protein